MKQTILEDFSKYVITTIAFATCFVFILSADYIQLQKQMFHNELGYWKFISNTFKVANTNKCPKANHFYQITSSITLQLIPFMCLIGLVVKNDGGRKIGSGMFLPMVLCGFLSYCSYDVFGCGNGYLGKIDLVERFLGKVEL